MEYTNSAADIKGLLEASGKVFPGRIHVISFPTESHGPMFGISIEGGNLRERFLIVLDQETANMVSMGLLNLIVNATEL